MAETKDKKETVKRKIGEKIVEPRNDRWPEEANLPDIVQDEGNYDDATITVKGKFLVGDLAIINQQGLLAAIFDSDPTKHFRAMCRNHHVGFARVEKVQARRTKDSKRAEAPEGKPQTVRITLDVTQYPSEFNIAYKDMDREAWNDMIGGWFVIEGEGLVSVRIDGEVTVPPPS
jgi:hypothetical protein